MPFIVLGLLMLRTDYGFNPYSSAAWIYLKKLVIFLSRIARYQRHRNELFRLMSMACWKRRFTTTN
jgi:hypothetical protein